MGSGLFLTRKKRLAGLAVGCMVLLLVLYVMAVRTSIGQLAGNAAIAGGESLGRPELEAGAQVLRWVTLSTLTVATVVITGVGLVRGGWPLAIGVLGAIGGANVATQVLKRLVFDRPALMGVDDPFGSHNSFPSGHATIVMSVVLALFMVLPESANVPLAIGGWAFVSLIGATMVEQGWHRPSDAIAGYLVATAAASVSSIFALWAARRWVSAEQEAYLFHDPSHKLQRWGLPGAVVLTVLGAAAFWIAATNRAWLDLTPQETETSFWLAVVFLAGSAAVLITAFLAALGGVDLAAPGILPGIIRPRKR